MAIRYGASAYKNNGSSSSNAAPSALNSVYWINLPNIGPTQIYCLIDNVYNCGNGIFAGK